MAGAPVGARFPLTAFLITWVIGASALLVAGDGAAKDVGLPDFERKRCAEAVSAKSSKEVLR
jgi:2-methylisocitrate lyase-like PEP mutase family enzyme